MPYTICQTTFMLFSQYFWSSPIVYASRAYIAIVDHPLTLLSWPLSSYLLQHHKALFFLLNLSTLLFCTKTCFVLMFSWFFLFGMNVYWMLFVYDRLLEVWRVELSGLWERLSSSSNIRKFTLIIFLPMVYMHCSSTFFTQLHAK